MIMNLIFINPLVNTEEILHIQYPDVDYVYYNHNNFNYKNDDDIIKKLDIILKDIDCTREYDCGRPCMINTFNYTNGLSLYYYTILKLNNQIIYNKYINKLIQRHIDNIIFEYHNPYIPKSNKKTKKNRMEKLITKDLFTGDTVYMYQNVKNKKVIKSSNSDLLKDINKKKIKKNKSNNKSAGVPISSMTFSFKKK